MRMLGKRLELQFLGRCKVKADNNAVCNSVVCRCYLILSQVSLKYIRAGRGMKAYDNSF